MRCVLALALLLSLAGAPPAQDAEGRRYGVAYDPVGYPQSTPALAVRSASKAAERGLGDYLIAHLVLPATVDRRVALRADLIRPEVDRRLRLERDAQRGRADLRERLPLDEEGFARAVTERAAVEAFRGVSAGAKALLRANPRTGLELRRVARDGTLAAEGDRATFTLRGEPREVTAVLVGKRWYVDDAQFPPVAPAPR